MCTQLVSRFKPVILGMVGVFFLLMCPQVFAGQGQTLGDVAEKIIGSFENLGKLITATSYLAGLGFSIGAILKFKQHKDNPTQIPIGTPIALLFVGASLLFLPSILETTGKTLFQTPTTATHKGINF